MKGLAALEQVERFLVNIQNDVERVSEEVSGDYLDMMVELNNQQLAQGIKPDGTPIGQYSPVTIEIKKKKGQFYDYVNLHDTGEMERRRSAKKWGSFIEIGSDVPQAEALNRQYGNTDGLTEENLEKVRDAMRPEIIRRLKEKYS